MDSDSGRSDRHPPLSDAKRALLAQRLRGAAPDAPNAIGPRPPGTPATLSAGQERLWFLHQLHPESPAYTMYLALRLSGSVDANRLANAVNEVVRRHSVLRTKIDTVGGRARPVIVPDLTIELPVVGLSAHDGSDRVAEARRHVEDVIRRPFDLASGPLLRASLLRLADDDHALVVAMHHIISDEWSLEVFWREVSAFYADPGATLAPLPIQYPDYAYWQRSHQGERAARSLAYWTRLLAGVPDLALPTDRPRPPRQSLRGALHTRPLPAALAARLRAHSAGEGVTLFMLLLAAFQALLHRYTGQDDFAVGVPVTNRNRAEVQPLIGFFLDTLVLRSDLAGDPPFRTVLGRVRSQVMEAFAHQDVPFERVVDALHPERRLSRNPLFQAMFVLQHGPDELSLDAGLSVEPLSVQSGAAKFDLTLFATEAADRLTLTMEYAADLFEADTIDRMLEHMEVLLGGLAEQPDTPLSALPLRSDREREAILDAARSAEPPSVPGGGVLGMIEAQSRRAPDAVAVAYEDEQLTYGQLWQASGRLAAHVRALGVGRNVPVGLCVERSPEMIVGLLGILRAGGAYVPLDPKYPAERLRFMLDDPQAPVLVTRHRHRNAFTNTGAVIVDLDADFNGSETPDVAAINGGDLAYIIYTSGSTGRPKGVQVTHHNLAHSTQARLEYYDAPVERFLLLSSVTFDSSVAGLFWTLASGGTLVLPPERLEQDVHALAALIERQRITHTLCLPSLYRVVLDFARPAQLASLRRLITAGEALPPDLAALHYDRLPQATLYNEYGPTETTVWATVHRVPRRVTTPRVPIGRPIPGARAYVLDLRGEPAPFGVPGELFVGGDGVTAGYLNRPDLTKKSFVPDPFSDDPAARLYRTGDRARLLPDGTLDFLGRMDEQVKIRGYRVELGEVEAALRQHPDLREAVAVVRSPDTAPGERARLDPTDTEALAARLRALDAGDAERILAEIEAGADRPAADQPPPLAASRDLS